MISPLSTDFELFHCGQLDGGCIAEAVPPPLLDRRTHLSFPHVEALHESSQKALH